MFVSTHDVGTITASVHVDGIVTVVVGAAAGVTTTYNVDGTETTEPFGTVDGTLLHETTMIDVWCGTVITHGLVDGELTK